MFAATGAEDAEDAAGSLGEASHGAAFVASGAGRLEAGENPFARGEGGAARGFGLHEDQRRRAVGCVPAYRACACIAVRISAGDQDDHGLRQAHRLAARWCRPRLSSHRRAPRWVLRHDWPSATLV